MNAGKTVLLHKTESLNFVGRLRSNMRERFFWIVIGWLMSWGFWHWLGHAPPTAPVVHDHGRTAIVFRQFCDGWPDNPTPLRCARVVWCWSHQSEEAIDWPLADAIPFLKELEEASTW